MRWGRSRTRQRTPGASGGRCEGEPLQVVRPFSQAAGGRRQEPSGPGCSPKACWSSLLQTPWRLRQLCWEFRWDLTAGFELKKSAKELASRWACRVYTRESRRPAVPPVSAAVQQRHSTMQWILEGLEHASPRTRVQPSKAAIHQSTQPVKRVSPPATSSKCAPATSSKCAPHGAFS